MFSTNFFSVFWFSLLVVLPGRILAQQNPDFISQNGLATEVHKTIFDPSGNNLIAYESRKGFVYDIKTGLERGHFQCETAITSLLIADEFNFYVGLANGIVEHRNLNNCQLKASYTINHGAILSMAVSNTNPDELLLGCNVLILFNKQSQKMNEFTYPNVSQIHNNSDKSGYHIISSFRAINCFELTNNFVLKNHFVLYKPPRFKIYQTPAKSVDIMLLSMNFAFFNEELIILTANDKVRFFSHQQNSYLFKESSYYLQEFFTSVTISDTFKMALAATSEGALYAYDLEKSKFIKTFKTPHLSKINDISVSADGLFFVTSSDDYTVILWDTKTLEPLRRIYSKSFPLTGVEYTEFSDQIITSNSAGIITVLDLNDLNILVGSRELSSRSISDFELLNSDSSLLFSSESTISMYDFATKKSEKIAKKYTNKRIDYSMESGFLNTGKNISDLQGKKLVGLRKGDKKRYIGSLMSPDQKRIMTLSRTPYYDVAAYMVDSKSSNLLTSLSYYELINRKNRSYYRHRYTVASGRISFESMTWLNNSEFLYVNSGLLMRYDFHFGLPDTLLKNVDFFKLGKNKNELYVAQNGNLCLYNYAKNPELIKCLKVGSGVTGIDWYDEKKLVISFNDGSLKLWSLETNQMICQFITIDKSSLIILNPQGYYMSINNGLSGVGYRVGEQIFPPEQFDLRFNRPDIILDQLGYTDSNLVNAYHEAYLRRLKKMGFTEDMLKDDLHLPEIKIENYASVPLISNEDTIRLKLKLQDSKYPLDRINVWVNDVAIFGTNGISLREKNVLIYETDLGIPLALGKNKIQISTLNQAGVESYKETVEIESTKGKTRPDLYVVTLGVSNYKDSRYDLTYASKDATDMAETFQKNNFFANVYSKTLINDQVKLENLTALKTFLAQADINDQVILFIAGHGVLDVNYDYYFASWDMDFQNPSLRGIPYEMIEALLDGIKPLKKLLLMDTCHSGEVDKDEIQLSDNKTESEDDIVFRNTGLAVENKENQLGLANTSELMKSLFTDLRKGTGSTVISSSGGVEFAMESALWKNGLFTYCFINGLTSMQADLNKDKQIMVSELQTYVEIEVSKLSQGKQTPTSRIENKALDYRIW